MCYLNLQVCLIVHNRPPSPFPPSIFGLGLVQRDNLPDASSRLLARPLAGCSCGCSPRLTGTATPQRRPRPHQVCRQDTAVGYSVDGEGGNQPVDGVSAAAAGAQPVAEPERHLAI